MLAKRHHLFTVAAATMALGFAATAADAAGPFTLNSTTFADGKITKGVPFYSGPCAPPNQTAHHYTFVLIAADFDPKELAPGLTRDELTAKFGPPPAHLKGTTGMIGLFVNPWHE